MKKTTPWIAAGVAAIALLLPQRGPAQQSGSSAQGGRTIQLVYHSDTRGYYRPCG